jgi:5'-nucleotidase (lipoprotein e(P4) family)
MKTTHAVIAAVAALTLTACAVEGPTHSPEHDLAHAWVLHSSDYEALTRQVYGVATRDLERFVADKSWSAMPGQEDAQDLPPAVILDVDETVINNVDFQVQFERPFTDRKLEMWDREHVAKPVPGVVEFVSAAHEAGIAVFYLTNRPCEKYADEESPCPQKQTVVDGIRELGLPVEPEFVSLALEQPGWTGEKVVRREFIARDYRVIMLIGDDFADFVPCARKSFYPPCTEPATRGSRAADVLKYQQYWGNGWYILPGPMHGSWTSVR